MKFPANTRHSRRVTALVLAALFFMGSACTARTNQEMQSWVGRHQSELILQWGPPTQTSSDGNGGQVLVYQRFISIGAKSRVGSDLSVGKLHLYRTATAGVEPSSDVLGEPRRVDLRLALAGNVKRRALLAAGLALAWLSRTAAAQPAPRVSRAKTDTGSKRSSALEKSSGSKTARCGRWTPST